MITIIGATGMVGLETLRILTERGHKVTAVTRDPAVASIPEATTVVGGDPSRADIPDRAWDGVDAVLLSPRAVGNAASDVLSAAAWHGARRVVVISAATANFPAGEPRFIERFRAVEEAAKASGLAWTFLRCPDFAANALAWAPQISRLASSAVRMRTRTRRPRRSTSETSPRSPL